MALQLVCDGCRTPLYTRDNPSPSTAQAVVIEGNRANGMKGGSPLPNDDFAWCLRCATIAFQAVQSAQLRTAGWTQ